MKYLIHKKLFYLILFCFFSFILLIVVLLSQTSFQSKSAVLLSKRFPSDVPKEVEQEILQLESRLGFDTYVQQFTKPYSEEMLSVLAQALNCQYPPVKESALRLLAEMIKQLDVPLSTLDFTILPAVEEIQRKARSSADDIDIDLGRLAQRVLWQIQLKEIPAGSQRLAFLRNNLENLSDGYYYSFEAMDHLVQLGSDEAKQILEGILPEEEKRRVESGVRDDRISGKASVSITKITLLQKLYNLSPQAQVIELNNLISSHKDDQEFFNKELVIWLIQKLATVKDQSAKEVLKHIWQDPSYNWEYQYIAQEELIKDGIITPKERMIK